VGMAFLMLWAASMTIAWGEETFIYTNQRFDLGNNATLVVEDADPQSGIIWVQIYDQSGLTWSGVMRAGQSHNRSSGGNFTVTRIYSGGDGDLVGLQPEKKMEKSSPEVSAPGNASLQRPRLSSDMAAVQALLAVTSALLLRRRHRDRPG
jgi:hypothetical protein